MPSDKERLDWLARRKNGFRIMHRTWSQWYTLEPGNGLDHGARTFRGSIDAAMREEKRGKRS